MSVVQDLGKTIITNKGAWINSSDYEILDVVTNAGSSYIALKNVPSGTALTDSEYWQILASKGDIGVTGNGIQSVQLNADYTLTITFTDGTSATTASIRGETGATGNGIQSIAKTATVENVDTYTITFTNGNTATFEVTNSNIVQSTGQGTDVAMSQKAVTDELDDKVDKVTGKGIAFGKVSEKDRMEIALDVELTGELIQEEKTLATLQNGWVNYGASYDSASFWKDSCGVVRLSGLIKSGTTTAETVILTLPVGYRPAAHEKFFCVSLNAICVIDVYATGNVAIKTGANSGWLSLSGISFRAS